jgi:hypothetical protein
MTTYEASRIVSLFAIDTREHGGSSHDIDSILQIKGNM